MSFEKLELLINGKWKMGSENKAEPVINPATNEVIGDLPHASKKDLDEALESNLEAFKLWKKESPLNRQKNYRKCM
jgi:succinate-semialdehyde dehydrogenase/glutarate-semialdehyde dehydrogenase